MSHWTRPHYQPSPQRPFVYYAVPGADMDRFAPTCSVHRLDADPPQGLELLHFTRAEQPQLWAELTSGMGWKAAQDNHPVLVQQVQEQTQWAILRGHIADDATLYYLRNTIGLVTALLDAGGVAVFDPFTLLWRSAEEWREHVFAPGEPQPLQHVITWLSLGDNGNGWLHTRGMGVFGRPDLSVRNVHPRQHRGTLGALEQLTLLHMAGGLIPEGQTIHIHGLRHDLVCHHVDDDSDPVFNNCRVEMQFVAPASSSGSASKKTPADQDSD